MNNNQRLIESTKKLLFEQHNSADRLYNSQQDSLDKAFTTILFAEIAFYISKITPDKGHFWLDAVSVTFIASCLFAVFISFIRGKATLSVFKELIEKQIYAIDAPESREELLQSIEADNQLYNKNKYILSQLNRHIPIMIFISTCLCFLKVSLNDFDIEWKIYLILLIIYIIISTVIFIFTRYKVK